MTNVVNRDARVIEPDTLKTSSSHQLSQIEIGRLGSAGLPV